MDQDGCTKALLGRKRLMKRLHFVAKTPAQGCGILFFFSATAGCVGAFLGSTVQSSHAARYVATSSPAPNRFKASPFLSPASALPSSESDFRVLTTSPLRQRPVLHFSHLHNLDKQRAFSGHFVCLRAQGDESGTEGEDAAGPTLRLRGGGVRGGDTGGEDAQAKSSWAAVAKGTAEGAESAKTEAGLAKEEEKKGGKTVEEEKKGGKTAEEEQKGGKQIKGKKNVTFDDLEDPDSYYFNSYSHYGIHEEMLKDEVRTRAYKDALLRNSHLLRGKTVLDVGCGTGILSMFAAQAGAEHVYAVDCSDMADTARQIIKENGYQDKITVYKTQVENLTLPVEKVDVIVSEWMGYCLLYEAMFDSVIFARDKWLTSGGMLLPNKASIHLAAIEDAKYKNDKINFWDNVYGFNMSCVKPAAMFEPLVDSVDPRQVATTTVKVWEADLLTATKNDMQVDSEFSLSALRNDYLHAMCLHFDVEFSQGHKPILLSTSPRETWTHWRQTVIYLHDELTVAKAQTVQGRIRIKPSRENKRHLDFRVNYAFDGEAVNGEAGAAVNATHYYRMR